MQKSKHVHLFLNRMIQHNSERLNNINELLKKIQLHLGLGL